MDAKHTPGPWRTKREGRSTVYVEASIGGGWTQEVSACGPTAEHEQQDANSRLIAAAPDLLHVLTRIVMNPMSQIGGEMRAEAIAVINKATGERNE